MKNKLKILCVFMLIVLFGLNTLNVVAADPSDDSVCGEGEILHTNYYLFLEVGYNSTYLDANHAGGPSGKWTLYTEAPKYNNIYGNISSSGLKSQGDVKITNQDGSLSNLVQNSEITWTAAEYWKVFYDTNFYISKKHNVNRIYEPNQRTTYFMHNGNWRTYNPDNSAEPTWTSSELYAGPTNSLATTGLMGYLNNNYNNLATSDLVQSGTAYPETLIQAFINPTLNRIYYPFRINRTFTEQTITNSPGFTLDDKSGLIYSPAVYYAQFCMNDASKKIVYDQNYEGEAPLNMPEETLYYTTCGDISDKRPERDGYTFLGWNTDKNASKPALTTDGEYEKYAPGEQYCDGATTLTLYAIWEKEDNENSPFTVTYDANGGTDAPAPQKGEANSCVKISDAGKMSLAKNKFIGWSTKEDAPEADKKYAPGTEYCGEKGDLTLYAVWNANTGISAHIIAFGLVTISAVVALIVAKKKNLFKQI